MRWRPRNGEGNDCRGSDFHGCCSDAVPDVHARALTVPSQHSRIVQRRREFVMADTGERRPIARQANAREAEMVRESKKTWSDERAAVKEADAVFGRLGRLGGRGKARQSSTEGNKRRSSAKTSK
jgi:hypothetical protein